MEVWSWFAGAFLRRCWGVFGYVGVEPKIGGFEPPKWMVKRRENPMNKWMMWGVFPVFLG